MKALILAAGEGRRLRPLTNTIPKHLLPVANKPILHYVLEQIQAAGIRDVGIVVSPGTTDTIKLALAGGSKWGAKITYIVQPKPLGLAHAVLTAQEFLSESPFLLFLGDNLIEDGVKNLVDEFNIHPSDASLVLKEVADPRAFGVAEVDASGKVIQVVEKPQKPKSNLALVGAYIFTPTIHTVIAQLKPSMRGEYEITDAIQGLLDIGKEVKSHILKGWWLDTGKKDDLLEANRRILDECTNRKIKGEADSLSQIIGRVEIGPGTEVEGSLIQGPVSIAESCRIVRSFISPYTSIGAGTVIKNSSIGNSIILNNSHIQNIYRLTDSIIGRNVKIGKRARDSDVKKLIIGDDASIEL